MSIKFHNLAVGLIISLGIISGQLFKLPVLSGGISILDTTVIVLTLVGLLKIKFKLQSPPRFIKAALVFLGVCIISLVFTPLPLLPNEYLNSFSYTLRLFFYVLFAWVLYSNAFPKFLNQIKSTLFLSGVGLGVLGLLQFIFLPDLSFMAKSGWDPHYFRTVSTFLDPNFIGAFFVLSLLLFLSDSKIFIEISTKFTSKLPSIFKNPFTLFIVIYLALLTTFSRSSYIMFLISGITISILKKSRRMAITVIILFSILLLGFKIYTIAISKPRNIDREKSASFRISTWQQGAQIFQNHPILGVGFNAYRYALRKYELGDNQFLSTHGSTSNDSSLLFVAATTGVVGLTTFLFFLFTIFQSENLNNRPLTKSIIAGLLIHSIFANSLFFPPILLWLLLISLNPKK